MARIRTIKPEFWKHEDLSALPEITHMLAAALLNHADDEGYFNANPALVKAECLPLRESSVSVQESLNQLTTVGFIEVGQGADGKRYGRIATFADHQRVNRPTPSKIKAVGIVWEGSHTNHAQLSESSPPERKGREGKGKEQGREEEQPSPTAQASSSASPPTDLLGEASESTVTDHPASTLLTVVLAAYHEILPNCRRIAVLNPKRRKRIQAADKLARQVCRQQGWAYVPKDFWEAYFDQCLQDPWLRGEVPNPRSPGWKQNLDVLLAEDRFAEIMDRAIATMADAA